MANGRATSVSNAHARASTSTPIGRSTATGLERQEGAPMRPGRAPEAWRGLLTSSAYGSVEEVHETAADVAAKALADISLTVEDQARLWGSPVDKTLRKPLPLDQSDGSTVMLELLEPADSGQSAEPLFERVWKKLSPALTSASQGPSMLLLTGVSGSGKTKAVIDIGLTHAFVVMTRVRSMGHYAQPWRLLEDVTIRLLDQRHLQGGSQPLSVAENKSALSALLLLLSCHLEWTSAVYRAARDAAMPGAHDDRVLHEVSLRAQRSSITDRAVHALFVYRLQEALKLSADGRVMLPLEPVLQRLRDLNAALPSSRPLVWCYDHAHVLLNNNAFDGLFDGTFENAPSHPAPAAAVTEPSRPFAAEGTPLPAFPALPEDIAACEAEIRRPCTRGWYYGLLVAARLTLKEFRWGHVLCGYGCRMNHALLQAHSPAQGISDSIHADTCLDAGALRAWYSKYLTADAMQGLDDEAVRMLSGRPLFGVRFFHLLFTMLKFPNPELRAMDPAAVVREALKQGAEYELSRTRSLVEHLWDSAFNTAKGGQNQRLVAWLYYLLRMGFGGRGIITPPIMSAETIAAERCSVIHVRPDDGHIDLAAEPITAAAILEEGDFRTETLVTAEHDTVLQALGRRVPESFGNINGRVATAEDIIAWTLVRRSACGPVPLQGLLRPFIDEESFPPSLMKYKVHLKAGLACDVALGSESSTRTFVDLFFTRPDGHHLLLHHTQQTVAGVNLAFLAQRPQAGPPGSAPEYRLVLVHIKVSADETLDTMLRAVDLGKWYPDAISQEPTGTDTGTGNHSGARSEQETASHAALRRLLEVHPELADPIRVLMSDQPYAAPTIETAAWVNAVEVPHQPVLLCQFNAQSRSNTVGEEAATAALHPPEDARVWWPTRVRHWPAGTGTPHPQEHLPSAPNDAPPAMLRPSLRVRFSLRGGNAKQELLALARHVGAIEVDSSKPGSCVVRFDPCHLNLALHAVVDAKSGYLKIAGKKVAATFVR